jgi:hypothetical protein
VASSGPSSPGFLPSFLADPPQAPPPSPLLLTSPERLRSLRFCALLPSLSPHTIPEVTASTSMVFNKDTMQSSWMQEAILLKVLGLKWVFVLIWRQEKGVSVGSEKWPKECSSLRIVWSWCLGWTELLETKKLRIPGEVTEVIHVCNEEDLNERERENFFCGASICTTLCTIKF